ncbi:MAG: efflux RND transporter periplasmic adaptor subunit [Chloroflexi bacterium]|nr:efflux RND transporter periplasmic adaptor subunit [Chloroflexota bacterium]
MMRLFVQGLFVIILLAGLTACDEKIGPGTRQKGEGPTVRAPIARAKETHQPFYYEAVGTVTARTASTISSKLMGVVRSVNVQEGDTIKKGDLLVTIDQRQVKAHLERALANAQIAAKEYDRYKRLLKDKSASQHEFDRAEARHREAQAAVAATQVSQKDAKVRAPYDGRVVAKMINPGDLASPGTPFLIIEQQGLFCTDFVLPERYIQAVKLGLKVKVLVPALNHREITGEIGRIVPLADARSRSFQVKVRMPPGFDLKSGMFARVAVPLGGSGMLLIPQTAIVVQGQLTGLFIVDDSQIAHFRLVRTGKTFGDQVEVVSGLQIDQQYVSNVPMELKDGAKVSNP